MLVFFLSNFDFLVTGCKRFPQTRHNQVRLQVTLARWIAMLCSGLKRRVTDGDGVRYRPIIRFLYLSVASFVRKLQKNCSHFQINYLLQFSYNIFNVTTIMARWRHRETAPWRWKSCVVPMRLQLIIIIISYTNICVACWSVFFSCIFSIPVDEEYVCCGSYLESNCHHTGSRMKHDMMP